MRKILAIATVAAASFGLAACDVEQTQEGEMPEVSVEGGQMPEYNVDTADVELRTEERTVEVPVLDIEPADASTN